MSTQTKLLEVTTVKEFDDLVLNKKNFHNKDYVFVDFYAQWCGPCKRFVPDLEDLCKKYGKTVYFLKVDIDELSELTERYDIMKLPTFMIFDVGSTKSTYEPIVGADKEVVEKRLKNLTTVKTVREDF